MNEQYFNHSPFVTGVWVENNGFHFKNPYMIRTKTGEEMLAVPNGGAWCPQDSNWVEDEDVTHIRTLSQEETPSFAMKGGWRIARDIQYFGKNFPTWYGKEHGFLYPNQIPEGMVSIPLRVMAYRNPNAVPINYSTMFITHGKLVETTEQEVNRANSIIATLKEYTAHKYFWPDVDNKIMSHVEIIKSIQDIRNYEKAIRKNPELAESLIEVLKEKKIHWTGYIQKFPTLLGIFKEGGVDVISSISDMLKDNEIPYQNSLVIPITTDTSAVLKLNKSRGPVCSSISVKELPGASLPLFLTGPNNQLESDFDL